MTTTTTTGPDDTRPTRTLAGPRPAEPEATGNAMDLFLRDAGRRPLLSAAQERAWRDASSAATWPPRTC